MCQRPVIELRPSTCHRPMRINSQKVWVFVASAILRKPRLIPSAKITFISPIRSAQGAPVRRWVNASVKPVAASTSSREIGDARGRDLLVEIEHQIFGACRRGGFEFLDMQNAVFNRPARDRACASGTAKLAQPHVEASLPVSPAIPPTAMAQRDDRLPRWIVPERVRVSDRHSAGT